MAKYPALSAMLTGKTVYVRRGNRRIPLSSCLFPWPYPKQLPP